MGDKYVKNELDRWIDYLQDITPDVFFFFGGRCRIC